MTATEKHVYIMKTRNVMTVNEEEKKHTPSLLCLFG